MACGGVGDDDDDDDDVSEVREEAELDWRLGKCWDGRCLVPRRESKGERRMPVLANLVLACW